MVAVHVFNGKGELVGPIDSPKLELTDEQWKERLSLEQYHILRNQGTERAFCGTLLDNKKQGVYCCAGCGLPLFSSDSKFNSGTGWPSFFQPIAPGNVVEHEDNSHGMVRTEIICARCDGHLGHVFADGPRPTGQRYCLNSESLEFTDFETLSELADALAGALGAVDEMAAAASEVIASRSATSHGTSHATSNDSGPAPAKSKSDVAATVAAATAVFAGGCFWCTEAAFEQLKGVQDVESGYTGASRETANYEQVCSGQTGHAEAIRITYDPAVITYEQLLDIFFEAHDPTQLNRQGADVGTQYRSAIFVANDEQRRAAESRIQALNARRAFSRPVVTTVEPLTEFYPAEGYHQDYARNNPHQPYIQFHAMPKACKIRDQHPELMKQNT